MVDGEGPSRDEVLVRIATAPDLASVFDAANPAFSDGRLAWGDDERDANLAARAWSEQCFAVRAASRVRFWDGISVEGSMLLAFSLEAAKLVAAELLRPLPKGSSQGGRRSAPRPLIGAATDAREAVEALVDRLRGVADAGARPHFKRELDARILIGSHGSTALDSMKLWLAQQDYEDLLGSARDGSLAGEARGLRLRLTSVEESDTAVDPAPGEHGDPFDRLVEEKGFEMVSIGPSGGAGRARAEAKKALSIIFLWEEALGVGPRAAGLGGMGLSLNRFDPSSRGGYSDGIFGFALGEGFDLPVWGHEWTHALDFLCKRDPACPAATELAALEQELESGPGDEAERSSMLQSLGRERVGELRRRIDAFLIDRARPELRVDPKAFVRAGDKMQERFDALVKGFVESRCGAWREWPLLEGRGDPLERRRPWNSRQAREMDDALIASLEAVRDPDQQPVNEAAAREWGESMRMDEAGLRALGRLYDRFPTAFGAEAAFAELWQPSRGYWTRPSEMLARAAEGVFSAESGPGGSEGVLANMAKPRGAERERFSRAYRRWTLAAGPWIAGLGCGTVAPSAAPGSGSCITSRG